MRARLTNGLKRPKAIVVLESLDCGRRTDAKRGDKAKRAVIGLLQYHQNSAGKQRSWTVDCADENSGMGYRADRTLVARQLGVVSVYVDRLNDAREGDQQDTQIRQSRARCVFARFVR